MTRKDYVKFAEMIRIELAAREPEFTPESRFVVTRLIADIFAHDNERFDRERFYEACEPKK